MVSGLRYTTYYLGASLFDLPPLARKPSLATKYPEKLTYFADISSETFGNPSSFEEQSLKDLVEGQSISTVADTAVDTQDPEEYKQKKLFG